MSTLRCDMTIPLWMQLYSMRIDSKLKNPGPFKGKDRDPQLEPSKQSSDDVKIRRYTRRPLPLPGTDGRDPEHYFLPAGQLRLGQRLQCGKLGIAFDPAQDIGGELGEGCLRQAQLEVERNIHSHIEKFGGEKKGEWNVGNVSGPKDNRSYPEKGAAAVAGKGTICWRFE